MNERQRQCGIVYTVRLRRCTLPLFCRRIQIARYFWTLGQHLCYKAGLEPTLAMLELVCCFDLSPSNSEFLLGFNIERNLTQGVED